MAEDLIRRKRCTEKSGHWLRVSTINPNEFCCKCSECGFERFYADRYAYCPMCGAKMRVNKMTDKEYLIDFMQTHNSEEIYDKIKELEEDTLAYNGSRLAFIGFLDEEYIEYKPWKIVQNADGTWKAIKEY